MVAVCFQKLGSSNVSSVDWNTLSKLCVHIVFNNIDCTTSPNTKPEVHLRHCGRSLGKPIWRHNSVASGQFGWNLVRRCTMAWRWRWKSQNQNRKQNFDIAAVCFQKPGVVISQPWIEIPHRYLIEIWYANVSSFLNLRRPIRKLALDLQRCDRHLGKSIWRHDFVWLRHRWSTRKCIIIAGRSASSVTTVRRRCWDSSCRRQGLTYCRVYCPCRATTDSSAASAPFTLRHTVALSHTGTYWHRKLTRNSQ